MHDATCVAYGVDPLDRCRACGAVLEADAAAEQRRAFADLHRKVHAVEDSIASTMALPDVYLGVDARAAPCT